MVSSLAELRLTLARITPWVAVAVVMAIAFAGYYSYVGVRHWNASQHVNELYGLIPVLSENIARSWSEAVGPKEPEQAAGDRHEDVRALFSYSKADDLVATLAAAAQEATVTLGRLVLEDRRTDSIDGIEYDLQPVSLSLQGDTSRILRFLSLIQEKVPIASVSSVKLAGLDTVPSANVQLLFYQSPRDASEDETEGSG